MDPTAVADVSPVSESDEIYVPTKSNPSGDQRKKVKKPAEGKAEGKAKAETDTAGSQVSPRHLAQKVLALKLAPRRPKLLVHPRRNNVGGAH